MTRTSTSRRPFAVAAVAAAAAAFALALPALAAGDLADRHGGGHGHRVPPPPAHPTSADQFQNIDQVRTAIKAYYGDTATTETDPVPNDGAPGHDHGDTTLHTFSPDSAYADEVADLTARAGKYLAKAVRGADGKPAIVLDVDDTTLNTYNYEIYSNFAYNPVQNGYFVDAAVFPAVPTMPDLVADAVAQGYQIFFITGRPEAQREGTSTNLTNADYATPAADHLFLKDQTLPWLGSCTPTCSSEQYKALTRRHLEKVLGYDILANFGDQPSDFPGGHADRRFKLPNPMYYLP